MKTRIYWSIVMFCRVFGISILAVIETVFGGGMLQNHLIADQDGIYHVFWEANIQDITFEVQVATKGYVGFGFSPNGGMPGSDVIIGWVLPNGNSVFHDRYAHGFYEPAIDTEQNYQLLNAYENETHTVMRFTRKLNTCDKQNDIPITDNTMKIIFCWHPDDPQYSTRIPYHAHRNGAKDVFLLSPQPPKIEITDDIITWDVQIPNVTIPAQTTTYWCIVVKIPELDGPHDYIGYTIHISPGNKHLVHHLILWECLGNPKYFEEKLANKLGYECVIEGTLAAPLECQPPMLIWAVGAEGQNLPDGVGITLGEEYGGPTYFQIQMHYNNVEKKAGIVDNSILRLYLSKKPKQQKAATLQIYANVDYTMPIPPKQREFPVTAYCPSECTKNAFPESGIYVFAVGLHTHTAGRKVMLRHFRGDKELKPIASDVNYDFNYQQIRQLAEPVKVLPGDMLMSVCEYSTMDRSETVLGGYGTDREMCFIYLSYYPATTLSVCIGGPDYQEIHDYFGVKTGPDMINIISPVSLQNQSLFDYAMKYDWTNAVDAKIKQQYSMQYEGVKTVACQIDPTVKDGLTIVQVQYPANALFYIPEEDECSTRKN